MKNQESNIKGIEKDTIIYSMGENYQYLKTIATNKVEILKLEILDHISGFANSVVLMLTMVLVTMISALLFMAAIIVLLADAIDSYLYAILIVNGGFIITSILLLFYFRDKLKMYISQQILKVTQ